MSCPDGFSPLLLPPSGYLTANGPFYAKRDGSQFTLGFRVEEKHCNSIGTCHGGMIATLCDVLLTVGGNVQANLSRFLPTISLTCDYIGPARSGAWVEGRLEVLRVTSSLVFASGIVEVKGEGIVARTSGILKMSGAPDPKFSPDRYFKST